jgi:hypothetical protein
MQVSGDKRDFNTIFVNLPNGAIKESVNDVIESLKNDSIVGEHLMKQQIPQYYIKRHNVQVLYRVKLAQHWRLVYTVLTFTEGDKPSALFLELMDHDQYNKRFDYFKKKSH